MKLPLWTLVRSFVSACLTLAQRALGTVRGKVAAAGVFVAAVYFGLALTPPALAGATCSGSYCGNGGDAVDVGFSGVATALTGYLADAVALVLAIVVLAVGIRMLVRWAKRAAAT
jgi:hypothetical protein